MNAEYSHCCLLTGHSIPRIAKKIKKYKLIYISPRYTIYSNKIKSK